MILLHLDLPSWPVWRSLAGLLLRAPPCPGLSPVRPGIVSVSHGLVTRARACPVARPSESRGSNQVTPGTWPRHRCRDLKDTQRRMLSAVQSRPERPATRRERCRPRPWHVAAETRRRHRVRLGAVVPAAVSQCALHRGYSGPPQQGLLPTSRGKPSCTICPQALNLSISRMPPTSRVATLSTITATCPSLCAMAALTAAF